MSGIGGGGGIGGSMERWAAAVDRARAVSGLPPEPEVFHNPLSGETLVHRERLDGTRDLFFGQTGSQEHGHAVLTPEGTPWFLRKPDGHVVADTKLPWHWDSKLGRFVPNDT